MHIVTKNRIFGKKESYRTQDVCSAVRYNFCPKCFFILRRTERDIITNVYRSSLLVQWVFPGGKVRDADPSPPSSKVKVKVSPTTGRRDGSRGFG